ncbi:MAG TPA: N-acetylmuramoyl-L-alanine amidase [Candidatus Limnocylindria bacterium]|nr:N-acetylmuramoyl-L-alanine amidase [Candidatus Limnocylindria bacterium]
MTTRRTFLRRAVLGLAIAPAVAAFELGSARQVVAKVTVKTKAHDQTQQVDGNAIYLLPFSASHAAVYWEGEHDAIVSAAFSADGRTFGAPQPIIHDEVGGQRRDGRTYGSVMPAAGATAVRITADRQLKSVNVLAMADGDRTVSYELVDSAASAVALPAVIRRSAWGCDESLMTWAPEFYPVQKLICHHTATQNNDPDPAATIRAIYYYHAVTQAWGDIGYNFLVDEAGRLYEGRYSRQYALSESPTGEDKNGNGVTAAHAYQYNSGTVGLALLGTLTSKDTTAAARAGIEKMLGWKAATHTIDPKASTRYVNPVTKVATTFANIAGHRDVAATECPGAKFYATLPTIRNDVAAMIGATPTPTPTPTPTVTPTPTPTVTPTPTPTPTRTPSPTPCNGNCN